MLNVYDELFDKKLIHIISDFQANCEVSNDVYKNTAIAVNLFYEDTLQQYFTYLENIPRDIEVYIYSSNEKTWGAIEQYTARRVNMFFFKKENRGRDISAFLVAFRKIALKKSFLCFLHDKKENNLQYKDDTDYWIENLWSNTINSEIYVKNVLGILKEDKIGILAPPIPFGNQFSYWYTNRWGEDNFNLTKELSVKLGLKCDIDNEKTPITLGSVFWCKTDAIRKILEYGWKYEDFQNEPLPVDGTISHAIERIFAYVAQDAGYTTEWILCSQYAGSLILKAQGQMAETYQLLKNNYVAENLMELKKLHNLREATEKFCSGCKRVYLYGAGVEGRKFANWMHIWELQAEGFVVTKRSTGQKTVSGLPIYEFGELEADESVGIIITVGSKLCREVEEIVKKRKGIQYYKPYVEKGEG